MTTGWRGAVHGYGSLIAGIACTVAALLVLATVAVASSQGACMAAGRLAACRGAGLGAAVVGMAGLLLLLRHVGTPRRD